VAIQVLADHVRMAATLLGVRGWLAQDFTEKGRDMGGVAPSSM
jgi:hypothetical protein